MEWEEFIEVLLEHLHTFHANGKRVQILVMLNRRDHRTGERLPLSRDDVQIRMLGM